MKYKDIYEAKFISRPNRFIANVEINGKVETVHVKNTGRCKELLIPGATVYLDKPGTAGRKTEYDLVAVYKKNFGLINIDSQAPNKVVKEWLEKKGLDYVKAEYSYGDSRIDFYIENANKKILMEVKGCTLEYDGIGYFPDAPTTRGIKHLHELTKARALGYEAAIAFVIQMEGIREVRAEKEIHPDFYAALEEAKAAGVKVLFLTCKVEKDSLSIAEENGDKIELLT